jgi:hypothetical protein
MSMPEFFLIISVEETNHDQALHFLPSLVWRNDNTVNMDWLSKTILRCSAGLI